MDTVESGSDRVSGLVSDRSMGRPLDYLIIHHMELDHSGEIENLVQRYPDVKIVGNVKNFPGVGSLSRQAANLSR